MNWPNHLASELYQEIDSRIAWKLLKLKRHDFFRMTAMNACAALLFWHTELGISWTDAQRIQRAILQAHRDSYRASAKRNPFPPGALPCGNA